MSIVLVIIGLIIGGILVGRDLIRASEVRAQIAQIEKYNSAVNTFRNKYGGLPGDLQVNLANQFGFATAGACNGQVGGRDGNGLLDGNPTNTLIQAVGETALFWQDLSSIGYIDATIPNSGAAAVGCLGASPVLSLTAGTLYLGDYFPVGKIGYGTFVYVYETNGANWYGLSAATSTSIAGQLYSSAKIPVLQAYNIDKKVDDGIPTSGSVQAVYINGGYAPGMIATAPTGATDTPNTCYSGTTPNFAYSLSASANGGSGLNCALSFRFE